MGFRIATPTVVMLLAMSVPCLADPLYHVTDLGTASPNSSYLDALSPSDQAAFRSGSFDVFAHPAQPGALYEAHQGDIIRYSYEGGDIIDHGGYVTSNNRGEDAGVGSEWYPNVTGSEHSVITIFSPQPHTVVDPNSNETIQSPGYVFSRSVGGPQFLGAVSGINDSGSIIGYTSFGNGDKIPFLLAGTGARDNSDLGNLGGKNGAASALNNSNQVVGWSEIAGGTHHAFFYGEGAMQDLNALTIPPPGVVFNDAVGIDDAGRIAVLGTDASGATHEYLLTPVPEPPSALVFLAVLAGLGLSGPARRRAAEVRAPAGQS